MDLRVIRVVRQGLSEVDEVAVEIDVVFVDSPLMREAVGVHGMHMYNSHIFWEYQLLKQA